MRWIQEDSWLCVSYFTLYSLSGFSFARYSVLFYGEYFTSHNSILCAAAAFKFCNQNTYFLTAKRKKKMTEFCCGVFFFSHAFWQCYGFSSTLYCKSVKIWLVCFIHRIWLVHIKKERREREKKRKYVEKRSYKSKLFIQYTWKRSRLMFTLGYGIEIKNFAKRSSTNVRWYTHGSVASIHINRKYTQSQEPYLRSFTFDWAQFRIKTCEKEEREREQKFGQSLRIFLNVEIVGVRKNSFEQSNSCILAWNLNENYILQSKFHRNWIWNK